METMDQNPFQSAGEKETSPSQKATKSGTKGTTTNESAEANRPM